MADTFLITVTRKEFLQLPLEIRRRVLAEHAQALEAAEHGPLPCQMPCPKCGSIDISRVFRLARETWRTFGGEHVRNNMLVDVDTSSGLCLQDCITHHCRICHHDWDTRPLAANAFSSATGANKEGGKQHE